MGAPSARSHKRSRPNIAAPTFAPGTGKLYEQREHPEDNPEAALKRWSGVGGKPDATFKPHIGKVYQELEESGALRVDSVNSRMRWEQINGRADKEEKEAGGAAGVFTAVKSLVGTVQAWANKRS